MRTATQPAAAATPAAGSILPALLPLALFVLLGFLAVGLPLAVLPGYVHGTLGYGNVMVGVVIGTQALAALLTRASVGRYVDERGGKRATLIGLALAATSGAFYLLAHALAAMPVASLAALLLGRVALGLSDSFVITGCFAWGMGRIGAQNAGRMMAIFGMAMFAAMTLGAPLGVAVQAQGGLSLLAAAVIALPALALFAASQLAGTPAIAGKRLPFSQVLGLIWLPGLGLASGVAGFAVLATFITLLFAQRGWGNAAFALTLFGIGYIGLRLFLAHLPDKLGGARVAMVSLLVEAAGLALIWQAPTAQLAFAGAVLVGLGFSLVFPSFGVEAIRRVPPQSRSAALGAYAAFFDLAFAVTGPLAGLVAGSASYGVVYALAGAVAMLGTALAWRLAGKVPALSVHH
ncbi:Predicted arabinose efflux permease, MFS family [Andreprevotia lacus DSM 23236]|uniref:Predicted arabinose efflux permease, MFS family n=1 Tax=Andreprevotia lacus DSM 23236 TaxID=1121001 RepID=A0A1W1X9C4_9NEIS|nr:MFS transporter [Andreprevotia lacus]SMC20410.1 Predicted arabinose efflux permease, MFS family [Andreprevotia lacus DSM 23236]